MTLMRQAGSIVAALAVLGLAAAQPPPAVPVSRTLKLSSPQIAPGQRIPERQVFNASGCTGQNLSPALSWTAGPPGTQSFALVLFDPDAPGRGWWHWIVYDIPAGVRSLPAGAGDPSRGLMPARAVQGRNDFGTLGYGGPCPPPGKPHRYFFWLYALRVPRLEVSADASPAAIGAKLAASAIARAQLLGLYGQ